LRRSPAFLELDFAVTERVRFGVRQAGIHSKNARTPCPILLGEVHAEIKDANGVAASAHVFESVAAVHSPFSSSSQFLIKTPMTLKPASLKQRCYCRIHPPDMPTTIFTGIEPRSIGIIS